MIDKQTGLYWEIRQQLMMIMVIEAIKIFSNILFIFVAFSLQNKFCVHVAFRFTAFTMGRTSVLLCDLLSAGRISLSYVLKYKLRTAVCQGVLDWTVPRGLDNRLVFLDETAFDNPALITVSLNFFLTIQCIFYSTRAAVAVVVSS